MKTTKNSKVEVLPPVIKSSIVITPAKIAGEGMMIFKSRGTTRWQRFKNIALFAWRYVMHGAATL